ncbi:MAG: LysR substrate-binding domain-containing protein [Beijerinckiaceae bacterium]
MISLDGIETFIKAAELQSFSAAGRVLRQSSAVVSHRVMVLEKQLGCRLFFRTTRRVQLTEQGRLFYEHCVEIRDMVERAESLVADEGIGMKGAVKVTAPLGLGRRCVAAVAAGFRARHPETEIRLRLSDYLVDLLSESVDIAVRVAVLEDSGFVQRKVADVPRLLCAAPAYLDRAGEPRTLADLAGHQCLMLRFPGSRQFRWPLQAKGEVEHVAVQGGMDADDGDVITEWALLGHGIMLKPVFEVAEHLAAGRLVPVLPEHPPRPVSLALLFPHRAFQPKRVKAFAADLHAEVKRYVGQQEKLWSPPR